MQILIMDLEWIPSSIFRAPSQVMQIDSLDRWTTLRLARLKPTGAIQIQAAGGK